MVKVAIFDCSQALTYTGFVPPPIESSSSPDLKDVTTSYQDVFTNSFKPACVLQSCQALEPGCASPSTSKDVTVQTGSNYKI